MVGGIRKMKAIDNKELILALEELEKEKGIKKEELLESIRTALITAYKRNFDALENVDVKMDEQTGATHVYAVKEVMERANDDALEISLEDARKINKELNIGDSVEVEIVPRDFGRIAAQTAKQVIIQKLRETERNMIFNEYNERKGEIVSGIIQKADKHIVVMDLGRLEGIMLPKDQIPTENYKVNDKIKGYALIGATTWPCITRVGAPYYQGDEDYFSVCDIQGKIKCGVDVTLYKKLFLNAELGYVLVSDGGQYYETFNQLAIRIGIGWRFGFKHA
jgi:DNA-directed RNA polymerase subunit E'/Rpb7